MDSKQKVLNMIGLATRAGKVKSGEFSTEKSVKSGRARLVIVAEDASENTRKMFENMCRYHHVSVSFFGSKEELGRAMGMEMRAAWVRTVTMPLSLSWVPDIPVMVTSLP